MQPPNQLPPNQPGQPQPGAQPPPAAPPEDDAYTFDASKFAAEYTKQKPPKPIPLSTQLDLSKEEREALRRFIEMSVYQDLADHNARLDKCAMQERTWDSAIGLPGGEMGLSNFNVPLIEALVYAKLARETDAIFGTRPGVEAQERGPADAKLAKKVSLAMKWQTFSHMKAYAPLQLCILRRLKHGRSFAKIDWERKFYDTVKGGKRQR